MPLLSWLINAMIASMMFFPEKGFLDTPENHNLQWRDVTVETSDQVQLHGWYLKAPQEKGVLLFFHGNAGNISHRIFKTKQWLERGISVVLTDYRGYGKSEGKIKVAKDILTDGEAFFNWLTQNEKVPLSKIILYGESIGSAPALWLAAREKVAAVILEAPFSTLHELARTHYPFVPKAILKDFALDNLEMVQNLKSPLFIIHGEQDTICPIKMGQAVLEKAPGAKEMYAVGQGGHNDLPMTGGPDFWDKPYQFISQYLS